MKTPFAVLVLVAVALSACGGEPLGPPDEPAAASGATTSAIAASSTCLADLGGVPCGGGAHTTLQVVLNANGTFAATWSVPDQCYAAATTSQWTGVAVGKPLAGGQGMIWQLVSDTPPDPEYQHLFFLVRDPGAVGDKLVEVLVRPLWDPEHAGLKAEYPVVCQP